MQFSEDPFLGEMLGKRGLRLRLSEAAEGVSSSDLEAGIRERAAGQPAFADVKLAADRTRDIRCVEDAGFRLADVNIVFSRETATDTDALDSQEANVIRAAGLEIRFSRREDRKRVGEVARSSSRFTRFHLDPQIPRETADRLKAEWAMNFYDGKRGDWMVVGLVNDRIEGFLQLLDDGRHGLAIDLINVAESARRKGLAREMIRFAERQLPKFRRIYAGTQLANEPSIAMYQNLGFKLIGSACVFHLHYNP